MDDSSVTILPLTHDLWADFETLFGPRGAQGGCWCMWWRIRRSQFESQQGEGNRLAMKAVVDAGQVPGLLAYQEGRPVGWCSVAPRVDFSVLDRSRVLAPVDDQAVWSVVCFFIAKGFRHQGLTVRLLKAAIQHAQANGARIVEGYPKDPQKGSQPDPFVFTGLVSAFLKTGFVGVARRSETRPIMRYFIDQQQEEEC